MDADDTLAQLVHRADLDGLVRHIDAVCAAREWSQLLAVRRAARAALATGRQLWPVATLAEYRLALWAPADLAAQVLDEDSGRFTIGPLTEVVAQHHTFAELRSALPDGPRRSVIAHERSIRGEAIDGDDVLDVFEMPFALQAWEPSYDLATYSDEGVDAPAPSLPTASSFTTVTTLEAAERVADDAVLSAVRQLVEPWTASSNGRADVACVEGDAHAAVGALGVATASFAPLDAAEALRHLCWAGASGGAHGRRRGNAIGRFGAWWLASSITDLADEWPVHPDVLGKAIADLEWFWWTAGEPDGGWQLQLAVHDPAEGYAWAISARDAT